MKQIVTLHHIKAFVIYSAIFLAAAIMFTSCASSKGAWYKPIHNTGCRQSSGFAGY